MIFFTAMIATFTTHMNHQINYLYIFHSFFVTEILQKWFLKRHSLYEYRIIVCIQGEMCTLVH